MFFRQAARDLEIASDPFRLIWRRAYTGCPERAILSQPSTWRRGAARGYLPSLLVISARLLNVCCQRERTCDGLHHRVLLVLHLHAIDSPTVSVASDEVTSQPSGAVTLLIRLVIDQPLKTKRPDWASQGHRLELVARLSSPSQQGLACWGCQQQACQIPCSFERR
jgi:hypothetical protein